MLKKIAAVGICIAAFWGNAAAQTDVTNSNNGTTNAVPLYTGTHTLGNSTITQSSGNVGIGTTSPSALFSVGSTSQFQVNSSGAITSSGGISVSGGTVSFPTHAIPNSALQGSGALTVTAGSGLSGGGSVALGSSTTLSLPNIGTAGTYGSATHVPVLTTDAFGRITGVTNTSIGAASGLTGSPTNGQFWGYNGTAQGWYTPSAGAVPGAPTSSLQYNNSGTQAGAASWLYDPTYDLHCYYLSIADCEKLSTASWGGGGLSGDIFYPKYDPLQIVSDSNTDMGMASLFFLTTDGTIDSPSTVLNGDGLGALLFFGYTGSSYNSAGNNVNPASFGAYVDGTVSSGVLPTAFSFNGETQNIFQANWTNAAETYNGIELDIQDSGHAANSSALWIYNQSTSAPLFSVDASGNVGAAGMLNVAGALNVGSGGIVFPNGGGTQTVAYTGVTCGGDYAESVDVTGDRTKYSPGDVLVVDPDSSGKFLKSAEPYSTAVTGIYSTKPGTVGRRQTTPKSPDEVPMAMIGIVPTKVSAENGPIKRGDLLVSSSTIGYAMKGTDRGRMLGAVIGKALDTLDSGTGMIEVLVTLQ